MRPVVDSAKAASVDVAVDLCRRERRVAEELLDDAKIGATFEEVGRERVPQPVRMAQEPTHGARLESPSADGQEHRFGCAADQTGSALPQVASQMVCGLLAERENAVLAALAVNVHDLALEVDVAEVEHHGLGAAQPGRVEELEERAVAQREGRPSLDSLEQLLDLGRLRDVGKPPRSTG